MKPVEKKLQIPFHRSAIDEAEVAAVREVMESGWLTMGPKTLEFEQAFARYVGARHAVAVSSCTAALHLALEAVGLQAQDEVLLPTTTFTATAEVVTYFGARPVFVDIDPLTMNLDPQDAARRITSRTRAIIPVHLAGQPCDMREIHSLADDHGLHVVEDAAHALPASYRGQRIGTVSGLTAFSFYATKPLATGEGGMVTTDREELANRIRLLRLHGISRDGGKLDTAEGSWDYEVVARGYKYNMTDLQAVLGLSQLSQCDARWAARCRIARRYTEAFRALEGLEAPTVREDRQSAWHLYILRLQVERLRINRDTLVRELKERGIGTSVHFIPLHLHSYYQTTYGYKAGGFPQAEREYRRCLSLPIYPTMSDKDVDRVIASVAEIAYAGRSFKGSTQLLNDGRETRDPTTVQTVDPFSRTWPGRGGFYRRVGKRLFDLGAAAVGLVLLVPLFALVATFIKMSSPGLVFYTQNRVGRGGRRFRILKFRTMVPGSQHVGPGITCSGDPRVTRVGRFLRRLKIDELPQLWNVLKGEMSLVGPRPDLAQYVAGYTPEQRQVLTVRPGMTDLASICYRDEEKLLRQSGDPEQFYREVILPYKLALNLEYMGKMSFFYDLYLIWRTLRSLCISTPAERAKTNHEGARAPTLFVPPVDECLNHQEGIGCLRPVKSEELMNREVVELALGDPEVTAVYRGKRILVTGAAGSIGSELVRQLVSLEPARIVLLDKDENALFERQLELQARIPKVPFEILVADIRFRQRLQTIFERWRPEVVLHAAAHKQVPLMESHPVEAVTNNVFGTHNVVELSLAFEVQRFVFVSTDKAVKPTSIMGASKRLAEMVVQSSVGKHRTRFCCVRFGNVRGSRSSVIPLFQKQIAAGGPVTLTHPEIRRFFMTIPEAAHLVIQAGTFAEDGGIYMLDMGDPMRIADLAHNLIELSGLRPNQDIRIETIGLRPGERLSEELVGDGEYLAPTRVRKIFVVENGCRLDVERLETLLNSLRKAVEQDDEVQVRALLHDFKLRFNTFVDGSSANSHTGVKNEEEVPL